MTAAEHKHDSKTEHDAVIKDEKDAEAAYQAGLKHDKAAEPPYVRPLERPHYTLTEACKKWDESVAAEVAAAAPKAKETKYDPDDEGDDLKSKGKGKSKKDDD